MAEQDGELGFLGAASIGLGGMIGGGVFSVLGVVATIAGAAAGWRLPRRASCRWQPRTPTSNSSAR